MLNGMQEKIHRFIDSWFTFRVAGFGNKQKLGIVYLVSGFRCQVSGFSASRSPIEI